jgi:hypothetical protein
LILFTTISKNVARIDAEMNAHVERMIVPGMDPNFIRIEG